MSQLVVDPTVVLKWYFPEIYGDECLALLDRDFELLVPDLLFSQVGSVLWRRVRSNELKADVARQILGNVRRLPLHKTDSESLLRDALEISTVTARSFQEALYFSLAIRNDTKLVTADRRWHSLVCTGPMKPYVAFVTEIV